MGAEAMTANSRNLIPFSGRPCRLRGANGSGMKIGVYEDEISLAFPPVWYIILGSIVDPQNFYPG
jgi:hypothetical protein